MYTSVIPLAEVYHLTVDEAHTYFVGDGSWLVHNACPTDDVLEQVHNHIKANGLPLDKGIKLPRQLTPDEMVELTNRYNLEFALGQERFYENYNITDKKGDFWLYSGKPNDPYGSNVFVPEQISENVYIENLFHTHLTGKYTPSGSDLDDLSNRWWQSGSHIIPNTSPAQKYPFDMSTPEDNSVW